MAASAASLVFCGLGEDVQLTATTPDNVLEAWELDQAAWREAEEVFVALSSEEFHEPLSYVPWDASDMTPRDDSGLPQLPLVDANELPVGCSSGSFCRVVSYHQ